ncbi:hypothetical protein [Sphingomonas yantingensis]|uniref:Lipoprotein n=1 Tax=Sphingomonas yantingensis TaxID=1241761 RepID=A0A7W9AQD6_9SPHN|nr:hypothetical protein [Sphingomonas yantingensis]MBB5698512.1 hypothetical protein [Sphingomonas yantingensis]
MRHMYPLLTFVVIAACASEPSPEEQARISGDELARQFALKDTAGTPIAEKCRLMKAMAETYAKGGNANVYSANQSALQRDAFCSTKPDTKLAKVAAEELRRFNNDPATDTRNRCAQHSLVAMAYREAGDGPNYDSWRLKTRAYCDQAGWRHGGV